MFTTTQPSYAVQIAKSYRAGEITAAAEYRRRQRAGSPSGWSKARAAVTAVAGLGGAPGDTRAHLEPGPN